MKKTMKKTLSLVLALMMLLSFSVMAFAISIDEAKEIALKDAGYSTYLVSFTDAEVDDNVYKVEFKALDGVYEYEINKDGKILSVSIDYYDLISGKDIKITADEAKNLALEFYGNIDVRALKVEYDADDNEYEVKFIDGAKRYEIEVSAYDGDITGKSYELVAGGNETIAGLIAFIEEILNFFAKLFAR